MSLVGARVELDALDGHQRDESDGERREDCKGNLRNHAANREHGVECVLNRLEKIFEKHRPAQNKSYVRIHRLADIRIH